MKKTNVVTTLCLVLLLLAASPLTGFGQTQTVKDSNGSQITNSTKGNIKPKDPSPTQKTTKVRDPRGDRMGTEVKPTDKPPKDPKGNRMGDKPDGSVKPKDPKGNRMGTEAKPTDKPPKDPKGTNTR